MRDEFEDLKINVSDEFEDLKINMSVEFEDLKINMSDEFEGLKVFIYNIRAILTNKLYNVFAKTRYTNFFPHVPPLGPMPYPPLFC